MKSGVIALIVLWAGLGLSPKIQAQATNTNLVTVAFATANSTPLNQGFAGFTTELLGTGVEYGDTNMQHLASMLSPGWLLYPAGTTGDAFDWATGLTVSNWINVIGAREDTNNKASNLVQVTYLALLGKNGAQFTNFAGMAANLGGAKIIVCVNGFTDTSNSAGQFAAFAMSNHISVAAWELCNEPYLFQNGSNPFFSNGTFYADQMKPYRDAIKAADSNAVVAVFFSDPARPAQLWDNALSNYSNRYWDAVVYHYYPELPTNGAASFAQLMALDNGCLFSNSTLYVSNTLMAKSPSNATFLLTEFAPCMGNGDGTQNPPTSTLYGGIYASEYVMRLSTIPRVSFAGSYQLVNGSGVDTTNLFWSTVNKAATDGYVTNTVGLPFGYFLSAQGSAEAVAYWALNRSTAVYATTVGTNGPTVPMDTNGAASMPAVYAQAYQGGNGKRYVLLTNKGSNAVPMEIAQDGAVLTNQFLETFVTGSDPSVVNTNPPSNNVLIQSQVAFNPVTIPQYSVVRLEWTVFNVPQPVLSAAVSNSTPSLRWSGLTNVVYDVQAVRNLQTPWTTLGKASSSQTNFLFTDPDGAPRRFYRLTVP